MSVSPKVKILLITGPSASGKSALGEQCAELLGWHHLEEDTYWAKNGWGFGLRTPAKERQVQKQVVSDIQRLLKKGSNIILNFVLYKEPPNPLSHYQQWMEAENIPCHTIILKPSLDAVMHRLIVRGRPYELDDLNQQRKEIDQQLRCVHTGYPQTSIVDSTKLSVEELTKVCLDIIAA